MKGKKIVVIGGSIAGCAAAVMLQRQGAEVVVLEKSSGRIGQGSGITLPEVIVNQCIEHDLFDIDIPRLNVGGRSFTRTEEDEPNGQKVFWVQSIRAMMFNWVDVYENLHKRIKSEYYHTNTEVCRIKHTTEGYYVETTDGHGYEADLIIAADGVDSTVRAHLLPDSYPEYTGYIAWRGVLDESSLVEQAIFNKHVPYYVFPKGHILLYRIPAPDFQYTGKTLLNWVMYEECNDVPLSKLLIDNRGKKHHRSLPAGTLTATHLEHLQKLAKWLPTPIEQIITKTAQPFIQAVFDFQIPTYASERIIFVGDAAATLRPHSASGVFKALANGLELARLVESNPMIGLTEFVSLWKEKQQALLTEESHKAKCMGEALVTHTPDWQLMGQESMEQWWLTVMQGKNWYATSTPANSPLVDNTIFLQERDKKNTPVVPNLESTAYKL